jgi:hypothetical protein
MNLENKIIYCSSKQMLKCIDNCYNINNTFEYLNDIFLFIANEKNHENYTNILNSRRILIIELLLFKESIEYLQLLCYQNNNISTHDITLLFKNIVDIDKISDCDKLIKLYFDLAIQNAKKYKFILGDEDIYVNDENNKCPPPPPNSPIIDNINIVNNIKNYIPTLSHF